MDRLNTSASSGSSPQASTQRVTAVDHTTGRIRIPRASKSLFPEDRCDIEIALRGHSMVVRWNPRYGPPERSGTLGIGKEILNGLVRIDDVLQVTINDAGIWELG